MNKISLDCSKCGGHLEITKNMELFKCPYCNMPYMVQREEGETRIIKLEERVSDLEENISEIFNNSILSELAAIDKEYEMLAINHDSLSSRPDVQKKYVVVVQKEHKLIQEYVSEGGTDTRILSRMNLIVVSDYLRGKLNGATISQLYVPFGPHPNTSSLKPEGRGVIIVRKSFLNVVRIGVYEDGIVLRGAFSGFLLFLLFVVFSGPLIPITLPVWLIAQSKSSKQKKELELLFSPKYNIKN